MRKINKRAKLYRIFILTMFLTIFLLSTSSSSAYELEEDEEGNTIIRIDGEEYLIPESVKVETSENNLRFINKGSLEEFQIKELTVSLKPNSELSLLEQNGLTTIDLKGEGDLTTESNYLPNIRDAKISLKDNIVVYAKLFVTEDETYFFNHNDKLYEFDVKKEGLIIFNPEEKIIEGENAELYFDDKIITGKEFTIHLEDKDLSEETNAISITESGIKGKGKVKLDTHSFSYEGLTDSTGFSAEIIEEELKTHIYGDEDRSLEEGGIAKFSKKFEIGDLLADEGFITDQSTIETIITRVDGTVGLQASTNSLGLLAELERNPTKFAIIENSLNLELGNNDANFRINSDFGMHYKNSEGSTNILSPGKTHLYLGDDKNTVTEIVKSQIQNKEDFNVQLLGIQKIYELGVESKISNNNNKELGFKGFESSVESFSETKDLIKDLYENDLQKSSALSSFILQNLESIEVDFTTQKYKSGQSYFAADKSQEARKESLIKSSLKEAKQNLNPKIIDYNKDLSNIKLILDQQTNLNDKISHSEIKSLVESQFQNQVLYDKIASTYLDDHKPSGIIDSYRALLTLEDTRIIETNGISTFESDPTTFSTRKLNLAEALSTEYAKNEQLSESIAILDGIDQNFKDYISNLADQTGRLTIENPDSSSDEKLAQDFRTLYNSGQEDITEALLNIKRKIDLDRNAITDTGFNRIQLSLYTQTEEINKIFESRKGYSDKVKDSLGTEDDLITVVFSGGYGKDILDFAGKFDKVKSAASILEDENGIFSRGIYGIQSLKSLGVEAQIIEDWINGKLSFRETQEFADTLLIESGRARANAIESTEFPGKESLTNRDIEYIGSIPYSFNPEERNKVIEFLSDIRSESEYTYNSEPYGQDIRKLIGKEPIISQQGTYQSTDYLGIDLGFQSTDLKSRVSKYDFSGLEKVLTFIDEGINPFSVTTAALAGGAFGTFFNSQTGLTGSALAQGENLLIDASTGTLIFSSGLNPEEKPILTIATGLLIGSVAWTPRAIITIAKSKQLAKQGFTNFADNIDDLELKSLGLKRELGNIFTDQKGNTISNLDEFTTHIGNHEEALRVSKFVSESQQTTTSYQSLDSLIKEEVTGSKTLDNFAKVNQAKPLSTSIETIERIRSGEYTMDEIKRIADAQRLLRSEGHRTSNIKLFEDAKRLNIKENADQLLISYYSEPRPLLQQGFSREALEILGDNLILGNDKSIVRPLLDSSSLEQTVRRIDPSGPRAVKGSTKITPENADDIFRHQYSLESPDQRGAKAITYIDEDGKLHTRFWPSGKESIGNDIHHMDALTDLIDQESDRLIKRGIENADSNLLDLAISRKSTASEVSETRLNYAIPPEVLSRSQGFQFTRNIDTGKIGKFEVDSGVTFAQIGNKIEINGDELSRMINAVHDSIPAELRGYSTIDIYGLSDLNIIGKLETPPGYPAVNYR